MANSSKGREAASTSAASMSSMSYTVAFPQDVLCWQGSCGSSGAAPTPRRNDEEELTGAMAARAPQNGGVDLSPVAWRGCFDFVPSTYSKSHLLRWAGFRHPDPNMEQFQVLQSLLRNLAAGRVSIGKDMVAQPLDSMALSFHQICFTRSVPPALCQTASRCVFAS